MASIGDILSCLPATISRDMEQPKSWWMQDKLLSGAAPACHFALPPRLLGHSATQAWSSASSISSSCSSSTSSSRSTSPRLTSGATLATFVGLNRRLESPSPPGTRSRFFTRLLQRPSLSSEGSLSRKPSSLSPPPSPIKLPWYFPASKPPVTKKDLRDAFLKQPNLSSPTRSPALGLGLSSQPLPPPSTMAAKRLLNASPFIVPLPAVALSRPSSSRSSTSSGSTSSACGTPLSFPSFGNSAIWSPRAAYTPQWPAPRDIAASFGLPCKHTYEYQAGAPCGCDNALGLLHAERNSREEVTLSSAYPGPPPGLPPPRAPPSVDHGLSELAFSGVENIEDIKLCGPDACYCCDAGAGAVTRHAPALVHAGISFKITSTLGTGASARVFGASHVGTGKRYAIKVIHKGAAAAAGFTRGEYLRELDVFRRIGGAAPETHAVLSTLKMAWEDVVRDRIFFVMDLYPTDLFSVLSDRAPITARDRRLYCQELISAVAALRDLGIVHGDIKPSNILISARGSAVLSDFGNASSVSVSPSPSPAVGGSGSGFEFEFERWRSDVLSGTPPYMAPEVVACAAESGCGYGYGARADVWSLGLVFLEIFARRAGAHFGDAWTVAEVRVAHAALLGRRRGGVDLAAVPLFEMPGSFGILLDSMLQYYEELRPTVEELAEWSARPTNWGGVDLGDSTHDWMPLPNSESSSWDVQDVRDVADFLSFEPESPASAWLAEADDPAEFEYRAPGAFA